MVFREIKVKKYHQNEFGETIETHTLTQLCICRFIERWGSPRFFPLVIKMFIFSRKESFYFMIVCINTEAGVDSKQKHADLYESCIQVDARRKGKFLMLDRKKKRNFQWVLLYSIYTHAKKRVLTLWSRWWRGFFLEILGDVNEKQLKIVLHCIFENNTKKNRTKKFATFESIALRRETENTQKKTT